MNAIKMSVTGRPEDLQAAEAIGTPARSPQPAPESVPHPLRVSVEEAHTLLDSEAEYELEYPAVCPACHGTIGTIKVVRALRTRVNFTSTLPRHGRVIICPNCRTILSAALTMM